MNPDPIHPTAIVVSITVRVGQRTGCGRTQLWSWPP